MDLINKGYKVCLLEDTLGYKNERDHKVAIKSMIAAGA